MNTQGHLRDCPLPALFKLLADQAESGCLRVEFQPEPALFYFRSGLLIDARMTYLRGFAAVHLAISRADAAYSFDRNAALPEATITDESERLLLSRVLGVRLMVEENPSPVAVPNPNPTRPIGDPAPTEPSLAKVKVETAEPERSRPRAVSAFPEPIGLPVKSRSLPQQALKYLTRQKLLRAAAAIVVIAIPAVVGLAVRLSKKTPETIVLAEVQRPEAVQHTSGPGLAPGNKVTDNKPAPAPLVEIKAHAENRPAFVAEKNVRTVTKEASPESRVIERSADSSAHTTQPQPRDQPAKKLVAGSKTIMVVVRIEDGHVAEAWVKDSRAGLEAYEATAIRLVRQRRYSKEVTRTETVPVSVTIN